LVAVEHLGFLILEMFFWTRPFGLRTFGQTPEAAEASAPLAANQGLYNGFLAAGLIWGIGWQDRAVATFFLTCVAFAGIFGGLTAKRSILFVQMLPALIALALLWSR
jgi:putative membrane protein